MTTATDIQHVIVGTAGHIDHGKTRLVGRLTGIITDRLPEEKARGISIDLGFAHWESGDYEFGVVDVPGHERFVKNMVAGATGVNLALLVVAADDSVMPQTREHLEIMDLLGVRTGVIAITKIDLVEPDFVELVQADVEELVAGTFLEGCPIVPVSSETGEGVDELKAVIDRIAHTIDWAATQDVFRMPIDRVFSITGHGSVVTGSALSGEVHAGEGLELLPEGREVRVRSVQAHGAGIEEGGARQRTAVNLAGLKVDELSRGMELATPGFLKATQRLVVELRSLASAQLTLKDRMAVNLHLGTAEIPARVILKGRSLKPGETAFAELRTWTPAVAAHGQRFILRRISPAVTIAGGTVLDPFVLPHNRIRDLTAYAESAGAASERQRLSFLLSQLDDADIPALQAAWRAGVALSRYSELCEELRNEGAVTRLGTGDRGRSLHKNRLDAVAGSVLRTIKTELEKHHPRRSLPRNSCLSACREIARPDLLEAVVDHLLRTKQLVTVGKNLGPADTQVHLTKKQRQTRDAILTAISAGGLMPPNTKELAAATGASQADVETLLNVCVEDAFLIRVGDSFHYSPECLERARAMCENYLKENGDATMSQLREAWGVSRKFSVPLCEYFDSIGVTVRNGDLRNIGPQIAEEIA
ncbi:MAG: selenocysteine-specific translation elongation factor [Planctomycetaceae bacterium]